MDVGEMKKNIGMAVSHELAVKREYDEAHEQRIELQRAYFRLKYGMSIGDLVHLKETGEKLQFCGFEPWSTDLDNRPDIMAKVRLSFGWAAKPRRLRGDQWISEAEREVVGNG